MQAYYGQRAVEYDSSMGYDNPDVVDGLRPIITELQEIAEGREVLELACGPCFWTQQITRSAKSIVATDFNETTLKQAQKKNLPGGRVSLQQADAYNLDSTLGHFDMVMAVDWFAHVPKSRIKEFLIGVTRRVPKGSRLVFIDQLPGPHSLSGRFDEEGNHIQERRLKGGKTFRVIKNFFSDEELAEWLSPHVLNLTIKRFQECRRISVCGITKQSKQDN